ncbi:NAD(P)H-dependent oxidoreductase [Sinorhizobium sp. BG8]|uniref:FMN-dependent NADH-azoreductase n=1 Tax=Sinorhizobium sp. BG8 TaxID=2613773 RepID=UPI00193DE410|nr:NAD(P)H-dependent oxidoreductase [Sinorhizobium sp. BG8]QRM55229.1 flavodoxin family protein [Sinorhizobium sp. BG8]
MKTILHVSCSPRGKTAESYRLSQEIIRALLAREPAVSVRERVIGDGSLQHIDNDYALSQSSREDVSREGSMAVSELLVRELEGADYLVVSTPMHNLTVPASLKAWLDYVVRARRTFTIGARGKVGMLSDRPVYVAVASGGRFSGEQARQPDFLTPYLTTILGTIGLHDLTYFSIQGTGASPEHVAVTRTQTSVEIKEHFALLLPISSDEGIHISPKRTEFTQAL